VNDARRRPKSVTFSGRLRRRLSTFFHDFYVDLNRDPSATVLLCGSGRSGTTWLVGVANYDNHYRLMMEPFFRAHVPAVAAFRRRQYLRPSNTDPAYLVPATSIFSGAIRDGFIDQLNRRVICSTRIVKDVRCTLMLGWLRARFPRMPIVLVLRHPCAVAYSRAKLGWDDIREDYLGQPELMTDYLAPFAKAIRAAKSDFERHVFDWCVENYVPFRQFAQGGLHLAFYENFCVDPAQELDRLFAFFGRPYNARIFSMLTRSTASAFTAGRARSSAVISEESLTESWRGQLSRVQIDRAYEIVASFGLERIYGRAWPDMPGAIATFSGAANNSTVAPD
jgi:hypothetical protein